MLYLSDGELASLFSSFPFIKILTNQFLSLSEFGYQNK